MLSSGFLLLFGFDLLFCGSLHRGLSGSGPRPRGIQVPVTDALPSPVLSTSEESAVSASKHLQQHQQRHVCTEIAMRADTEGKERGHVPADFVKPKHWGQGLRMQRMRQPASLPPLHVELGPPFLLSTLAERPSMNLTQGVLGHSI